MEKIKLESVLLPESEDFYDSIYCEKCQCLLRQPCWLHATIVKDENIVPLSFASLPDVLCFGRGENEKSVFAKTTIRPHTVFGPLFAPPLHSSETSSRTIWNSFQPGKTLAFYMDNDKWCNWMKHVTVVRNKDEQNMKIYLLGEDVVFVTVKVILPGEELKLAVGHNWAMRTCGSSRRITFGDMDSINLHLGCRSSDTPDNIPLPVFALESHTSALAKAEDSSKVNIELPVHSNDYDENGLPCASENDPQSVLLVDNSSSDFDMCRTVIPPVDCDTQSSLPSLPLFGAEYSGSLCSFQRRNDREDSPEYPFPPLRQLNISTMSAECQQHGNEVGNRKSRPQKNDSTTESSAVLLPFSKSTDKHQQLRAATVITSTADGTGDEKESWENGPVVDAAVCIGGRNEVGARLCSLRPRAVKTASACAKRKQFCQAEKSPDDDMIDDSDVDADWCIHDNERHSSTGSEEWLDYEFAPPTKKSKSSDRRFEAKETKNSFTIQALLAMPVIAVPITIAETSDSVGGLKETVPPLGTYASETAAGVKKRRAHRRRPGAKHRKWQDMHPSHVYRFKCPECSLHFRLDLLLQWHRQFHHSNIVDEPWMPKRKCAACLQTCTKQQAMMRHVDKHGVQPSRIRNFVSNGDPAVLRYAPGDGGGPGDVVISDEFPVSHETHDFCFMYYGEGCCGYGCSLRFCSESLLDLHKTKHVPPKNYEGTLVCPGCQYQADSPEMLFDHVDRHGAARKDRKMCWRCAEYVTDMKKHAVQKHKEEFEKFTSTFWPFACDQCEKRWRTSAFLHAHKVQVHAQCYVCAAQFPTAKLLKEHSAEHRTEAGFVCPTCQRSFQSYSVFSSHTKRHNPNRVSICNVCQAVFSNPDRLNAHKIIHETQYKHHCDECEKSFKRSCNLWQHKKQVHSDMFRKKRKERKEERLKKGVMVKYVCPRRTMRYEDYPFKCEECRLGWLKLGALEQHKMRKHAGSASEA